MKLKLYFTIWALVLHCSTSLSQIGIQTFDKGKFSYKSLLNQAKEQNALLLLVLYSPGATMNVLPKITNPESILSDYNLVTDVADPFIEMLPLVSERLRAYYNPEWVVIHPDNFAIIMSSKIESDDHLRAMLDYSLKIKNKYDRGSNLLEIKKDDPQGLKQVIAAQAASHEKRYVKKYLNRFIKNQEKWNDEDLLFIAELTELGSFSSKQENVIDQHRKRIAGLSSEDKLMAIDRQIIVGKLNRKGLYEPYMIWKEFEKKFGSKADSLYRLEAINYFNLYDIDKESLITEMVDYMAFYPRTPWKDMDPMFGKVISMVSSKEDLELLQDLIEGQLFQGKNYRKLDYKALILYRLGKKERSLALIEEVRKLAFQEGLNYKSMIHSLIKTK